MTTTFKMDLNFKPLELFLFMCARFSRQGSQTFPTLSRDWKCFINFRKVFWKYQREFSFGNTGNFLCFVAINLTTFFLKFEFQNNILHFTFFPIHVFVNSCIRHICMFNKFYSPKFLETFMMPFKNNASGLFSCTSAHKINPKLSYSFRISE